jgi:hypothetical protein
MAFTDPFKLRVLKGLTNALKTITPANGYVSDLSDFDPGDGIAMARVYRGRMWYGDESPLPMVSVIEGADPADAVAEPPAFHPVCEYDYALIVQGWAKDDPLNPTDPAYALLADIRRCLAIEATRKIGVGPATERDVFGLKQDGHGPNAITGLRFGPGVVRMPDDLSDTAWWWLTVYVRIMDVAAKPYE